MSHTPLLMRVEIKLTALLQSQLLQVQTCVGFVFPLPVRKEA